MANYGAFLLIASLLVAVAAFSGADARPSVPPEKTAAALPDADDVPGRGLAEAEASPVVADPDCNDDDMPENPHRADDNSKHAPPPAYVADSPNPATTTAADSPKPATMNAANSPLPATTDSVEQEQCTTCEVPPPPEPACNPCEEPKEPELICKKVHAVRDGETCYSVGQCARLGQDDFLKFNPNICCDHLFVGQWVCLDAECSEESD